MNTSSLNLYTLNLQRIILVFLINICINTHPQMKCVWIKSQRAPHSDKRALHSLLEPYILSKEPYLHEQFICGRIILIFLMIICINTHPQIKRLWIKTKRALHSDKRALHSLLEPYILSKEPYLHKQFICGRIILIFLIIICINTHPQMKCLWIKSKRTLYSLKRALHSHKESCILSKEPCILSKEPYLHKHPSAN